MSGLLRAAILTLSVQPDHLRNFEKAKMSGPQNEILSYRGLRWGSSAVEGEDQRSIVFCQVREAAGQGNGQQGKNALGKQPLGLSNKFSLAASVEQFP